MQPHSKLIILQNSALCQHWLTSVHWQGCLGGRVLVFPLTGSAKGLNQPWTGCERGLCNWETAHLVSPLPFTWQPEMGEWKCPVWHSCQQNPTFSGVPRVCGGGWWEFLAFAHTLQHSCLYFFFFSFVSRPVQPRLKAEVLPCSQVPWGWVFCCPWSPIVSSAHTTWAVGSKAFVLPTTNF